MEATDWPDKVGNETDFGTFAGHFYDPDTGKNWMGQTSPTARTRAETYYENAVIMYQAGDINRAMDYLGKGTHYVSDLNEPHHASNLTAVNSNHSAFEKYVDKNRTSYTISGNSFSSQIYNDAVSLSVGDLMYSAAKHAKGLVDMAQNESTLQDTTLYVNGRKIVIKEQGDKIKVKLYESASGGDTITNAQIFEGVYLNGQSTESRTVLSALPFSKKNNKRNRFEPHAGGFYIGYTRLSNDFLSFNPSNGADLNTSHSWEIGGNLFTGSHAFAPTYNWGITIGLGWGYRSMRLDGNDAFREIDGVTEIYSGMEAEEPIEYSKSRLRYFYFRIPLSIEWQTRLNGKGPLFFAVGPEAEIRHGFRSKAKVNGSKKTIDKGLNGRPLGINLLAQAGYADLGVYMRYSTYGLFEKNKGPELYPFSFGVCWYW